MYKIINEKNIPVGLTKEKDGVMYSIPFAPDNKDYQEYLAWVAEGNTPEPADE